MPTYAVETDQGKFQVELDSEPGSDQELQTLVSQNLGATPPETTFQKGLKTDIANLKTAGAFVKGAGETALHAGSSLVGGTVGALTYGSGMVRQGFRFLGKKAFPVPEGVPDQEPVDLTEPERQMEEASRTFTYEPKTKEGKIGAAIVDYPFEKLQQGIDSLAKTVTTDPWSGENFPVAESIARSVGGIVIPATLFGAGGRMFRKTPIRPREGVRPETAPKAPSEAPIEEPAPDAQEPGPVSTESAARETTPGAIAKEVSLEELPKIDLKELQHRIDALMARADPDILMPSDHELREILANRDIEPLDISAQELKDALKRSEESGSYKPEISPEEKFRKALGLPTEEENLQAEEAQGRSREAIERHHAAIKTALASVELEKANKLKGLPPPEDEPPAGGRPAGGKPPVTPPVASPPPFKTGKTAKPVAKAQVEPPGPETLPSNFTDFEKDYLGMMEKDLVAGQSNGLAQPRMMDLNQDRAAIPSTNPDWFKNMGEAKSNVLKYIMKAKNDLPMTPRQDGIVREMLERKRQEIDFRERSLQAAEAERASRMEQARNEFFNMGEEENVPRGTASGKTPSIEELKQEARTLGQSAFESGEERAPVRNNEMVKMLENRKPGELSVPLLNEYLRGWDEANVAKGEEPPKRLKKQGELVRGHEVPTAKIETEQGFGKAGEKGTLFEEGGPNAEIRAEEGSKKKQQGLFNLKPKGGFMAEAEIPPDVLVKKREMGISREGLFKSEKGAARIDLLTMGAEQFGKQDLLPAVRSIVTGLRDSKAEIFKAFNPMKLGEAAKKGAETIRSELGLMMRSYNQAEHTLGDMNRYFEKLPLIRQIEFQRRMDLGAGQANPGEDAMARVLRMLLDQKLEEVRGLGTGKLQNVIENYFPRFWKEKTLATQIFGKRPFQGSKRFLKPRTIKFFSDAIDKGLTPLYPNPVKAVLAHVYEVNRYIAAEHAFKQAKIDKLAKFIPAGYNAPADWVSPKDPMFTVYGDPSVKLQDTLDRQIYNGLNKLAGDLGVPHERLVELRGESGILGLATKPGPKFPQGRIQSKFSSPESVLAHEIGHILDYKYGLQDVLMKNPDKAVRIPVNKELRKLADQRWAQLEVGPTFKKYVRKGPEKMAVILESYIHAPELLKEHAPTVYDQYTRFLDAHPELAPLKEIKPGLTYETIAAKKTIPGLLVRGHWYVPRDLGKVYDNFLNPGLRPYAFFRAYLGISNVLNHFQLGLSAFHLGFTSLDSVISKVGLGILQASRGDIKQAARSFLEAPASPIQNILRGDKLLKAWRDYAHADQEMGLLANALAIAGGRTKMDDFYKTHIAQNMVNAFKSGNVIGGLVRAPFALVEQFARPIMEEIVPRQKLGAFADLAKYEMQRLVEQGATPREVQQALMKIWDSVDNRMGQLVYDNLFWDKTAKDLAMGSVRSLGWNLGTFRELGGALTDALGQGKEAGQGVIEMAKYGKEAWELRKPEMTYRQSYAIALPLTVGLLGAVATYLMTGEGPKDRKDYYYPRTGNIDQNGLPERVSLPSYMKDVYAYYNDFFRTLANKLNPGIAVVYEMLINRDYFGVKIRNEDDPLIQKLLSEVKHGAKTFEPFASRGIRKLSEEGAGPVKKMLPFVGITPAPSDINKTQAEELAARLAREKFTMGSRTAEKAEKSKMIHNFAMRLAANDPKVREEIKAARDKISVNDLEQILTRSRTPMLTAWARELDYPELTRVFKVATPAEKAQLTPILVNKGIKYSVEYERPEIKEDIRKMIHP